MTDTMKELCYVSAASAAAVLGAIEDLRSRRIPNFLTGSSLICGLVLHLALGGFAEAGYAALAGLGAGALLLAMYLAGGMGAGDVKLMAAVGCLAGCSSIGAILTGTFVIGAIFGIALALYHRRFSHTVRNALHLASYSRQPLSSWNDSCEPVQGHAVPGKGLSIPYAVPIAAGCLMSLGSLIWKG